MARGRRLDPDDPTPTVSVHFKLPAKQYDLTYKQAAQARMTLADYLRLIVDQAVNRNQITK